MEFLGWENLCAWRECHPRRKGKNSMLVSEWWCQLGVRWEGLAYVVTPLPSSCRSTPCTAEQVPAFRKPSKNLLPESSPTQQFELLPPMQPQGLLKMPSGSHNPHWDVLTLPPVGTKIVPIPEVSGIQGDITTY